MGKKERCEVGKQTVILNRSINYTATNMTRKRSEKKSIKYFKSHVNKQGTQGSQYLR